MYGLDCTEALFLRWCGRNAQLTSNPKAERRANGNPFSYKSFVAAQPNTSVQLMKRFLAAAEAAKEKSKEAAAAEKKTEVLSAVPVWLMLMPAGLKRRAL